jgi:hypothetical protein
MGGRGVGPCVAKGPESGPGRATAANVFKRSRVDRANRSRRVTISTSPLPSRPRTWRNPARSVRAPLAVSRKTFSAPAFAQLLHLRVHALTVRGSPTVPVPVWERLVCAQIAVIAQGRSNRRGLNRQAGRKRRCATVPPAVSVRKRPAPCSCALARHSLLRREPCKGLLASPFRPRLGVRHGWSPFPEDSSHGQTTR